MPPTQDHYQVLGLEKDCTVTDLKNAYRRLALLHHPDKNPGCEISEEKFKQINNAYETLIDPEKRTIYNTTLPSHFPRPQFGQQTQSRPQTSPRSRPQANGTRPGYHTRTFYMSSRPGPQRETSSNMPPGWENPRPDYMTTPPTPTYPSGTWFQYENHTPGGPIPGYNSNSGLLFGHGPTPMRVNVTTAPVFAQSNNSQAGSMPSTARGSSTSQTNGASRAESSGTRGSVPPGSGRNFCTASIFIARPRPARDTAEVPRPHDSGAPPPAGGTSWDEGTLPS